MPLPFDASDYLRRKKLIVIRDGNNVAARSKFRALTTSDSYNPNLQSISYPGNDVVKHSLTSLMTLSYKSSFGRSGVGTGGNPAPPPPPQPFFTLTVDGVASERLYSNDTNCYYYFISTTPDALSVVITSLGHQAMFYMVGGGGAGGRGTNDRGGGGGGGTAYVAGLIEDGIYQFTVGESGINTVGRSKTPTGSNIQNGDRTITIAGANNGLNGEDGSSSGLGGDGGMNNGGGRGADLRNVATAGGNLFDTKNKKLGNGGAAGNGTANGSAGTGWGAGGGGGQGVGYGGGGGGGGLEPNLLFSDATDLITSGLFPTPGTIEQGYASQGMIIVVACPM